MMAEIRPELLDELLADYDKPRIWSARMAC